jgi:hypothetical protein
MAEFGRRRSPGKRVDGVNSSRGFESLSLRHTKILAVLDGEVAVPCNLQPAIAGLKAYVEASQLWGLVSASGVDGWVLGN